MLFERGFWREIWIDPSSKKSINNTYNQGFGIGSESTILESLDPYMDPYSTCASGSGSGPVFQLQI